MVNDDIIDDIMASILLFVIVSHVHLLQHCGTHNSQSHVNMHWCLISYQDWRADIERTKRKRFSEYVDGLNAVDWDQEMIDKFQTLVKNGSQESECGDDDVS